MGARYGGAMTTHAHPSFGDQLRDWRQRRRLSQMDLALDCEVSTRHLSFLETGRSRPSREMVIRLCERLEVPLRERNGLLIAAGLAPEYGQRPLSDPAVRAVREAVDMVLAGHEPYPALAVDRHWTLVAANRALGPLIAGASAALLVPPVNVLRLGLHPDGIAPRIRNLPDWRDHILARLGAEAAATGDVGLAALLQEFRSYPVPQGRRPREGRGTPPVVVPLVLEVDGAVLNLISTTTVFGTPLDVMVAELAIESFFPADPETADALRRMANAVTGA